MTDTNLVRFRAAVAGALEHLESRRQEVNDLNVFPVADGDTGDNMVLTLRAVLDELDRLQGTDASRTIDEIGREEIVQSVARAALLGARGNSGVILSQLIRGAAEELVSRPGELIDATLIGAALANAADRAYASVRDPAEGTILTVAREMARQIASDVAHATPEGTRLGPATEAQAQDLAIAQTLEGAVSAGQESVKRGPEMLPALREAGVVDAGGYGLTVLFAGVVAALRGEDPPELDHYEPARIHHPEHHSSTYRYCTNFAVTGQGLAAADFIDRLEALGDSVLVVGDSRTLKIHVHTDEPERATAVFAGAGEVSHLDVADMRLQVAARSERLGSAPDLAASAASLGMDSSALSATSPRPGPPATSARCGAVAVVSGAGLARMFEELGVHTVDGGPTLNPSTYELLAAIHDVEAEEVLVLPNSTNVRMAAERAAELSDKQVVVVSSTSQQTGLAAAVALAPERSVEENAWALQQALDHLRSGAVAPAARADAQGRFQPGEAVGFVEDEMVAWGDPGETLRRVLVSLATGVADSSGAGGGSFVGVEGSSAAAPLAGPNGSGPVNGGNGSLPAELVSVLAGANAPLDLPAVERLLHGTVVAELELRDGGQPAYWWLLAAE